MAHVRVAHPAYMRERLPALSPTRGSPVHHRYVHPVSRSDGEVGVRIRAHASARCTRIARLFFRRRAVSLEAVLAVAANAL